MPNFFRAVCLWMLAALPSGTLAQAPQATNAEADVVPRFIEALCMDLMEATPGCEMAILLQSETLDQMADLLIHSADGVSLIVARDLVFSGSFEAQTPSLEAGEDGVLYVHSQQFAVGRTPWTETLAVREVGATLEVVGYHHSMLDRPSGGHFFCNVDLRTGDWRADAVRVDPESGAEIQLWEETGTSAPDTTPLIYWSWREPPTQCDTVMGAWFDAAP